MTFPRIRLFVLFLLAVSNVQAQEQVGLQLFGDFGAVAAISQSTEVEIRVAGLLARTTISQRFTNHTADRVEGRYVFPLPDGASVDELRITIGQRIIEGQVREKFDAKRVFEQAREHGQTAGLVEQHRANLFSTSLANIAPGEEIVVAIGFGQTVAYEHGRFTLRFPTTTLPRFDNAAGPMADGVAQDPAPAPRFSTGGGPRLQMSVDLQAGIEIAALESLHHPVAIHGRGSERTIELADPENAAGRDFELVWTAQHADRLQGALFVESMHDRAHALLMLLPPQDFRPVALRRELVLVIDRSGSMRGQAFDQARQAMQLALQRIGRDDRFNVIAFSNTATALFDGPVAASRARLDQARRFIDGLEADGGTGIDDAIGLAMGGVPAPGYLRQIVFATDGAIANEQQLLDRIHREIGDSRLFAIGIGHGVNDAFLKRCARMGHGTTTLIKDERDIAGRIGELLLQLESPVLEDLRVDWPITAEVWPERLPDLYAGEPLMVLARLDAPVAEIDVGTVRATGFNDLRFVEMEWPMWRFHSATGVARAWAGARIQGLAERPPGSMDEQLRRDERLLTALDYGIVSPLTSLVAVDRTPLPDDGTQLQRVLLAGAPPADRDAVILQAMPATDAGSLQAGARAISTLLIVLLLVFNRRFRQIGSSGGEARGHDGERT